MSARPDRTPLKRMLLHMLRHGGLKRANDERIWYGADGRGQVAFYDKTIITAGECGFIVVSVNRRHRAKQFARLTPKGMERAKLVAALLRAREQIEAAMPMAERKLVFPQ